MNSEVKVQIGATNEAVHTVLIGKASDPLPIPQAVTITGDINSPGRFASKRKDTFGADAAHVIVNRTNRTITLIVDETNPLGKRIEGTLSIHPDLKPFNINQHKLYTIKELADLLRMRRQFFRERERHNAIMKGLAEFSAKTDVEIRQADDRKGNAESHHKRTSRLALDLEFVLHIPVFNGFNAKEFHVDILADVTDGGVRLWLESVELAELMHKEEETIFAAVLDQLTDYVIIEQ